MNKPGSRFAVIATVILLAGFAGNLWARSVDGAKADTASRTYIVRLSELPLARQVAAWRSAAITTQVAGGAAGNKARGPRKLDLQSAEAQAWLRHLDQQLESVRADARARFGLDLQAERRFRVALNAFTTRLTPDQAAQLVLTPGVAAVEPEFTHRMHTDAGPRWLHADDIWVGTGTIPESRGEGVVIGVIDSGIAWDHAAFADPGQNGGLSNHNHVNPFGQQLGLCSLPAVVCNDKLVGVYDFVEDNPNTDVVEENNDGYDNTQHGSLVASVAAGNPLQITLNNTPVTISGVAPNANIVSYRVCYRGDENDPEDDACQGSAILEAIDQAVLDGVDVINYSLGSNATSPWNTATALAFLGAYEAGIVVVTSSGNEGPVDASIGSPGNSPWLTAVGSTTHDRLVGNALSTQGGNVAIGALYGASLTSQSVALMEIVHAADYGYPLCGDGPDQSQPTCAGNTGTSNPFAPGTFTNKIVVCDRGTYGRVEKGKNVLLAGAVGFVLANTDEFGEEVVADEHCLAATHLGRKDSDRLRDWLDAGSGHQASLSSYGLLYIADKADRLSDFSSRGPNRPPVEDVLKPNLIAPGHDVVGAGNEPGLFIFASGTSFASPHVAGAAALLKSIDPDASPGQIASVLALTATPELATDENGDPATPHERGAGRPRLDLAARAGLYLDETVDNFVDADPETSGDPRDLNLPTLTDTACSDVCSFTRGVRAVVPNLTWTASAANFPAGVQVTVTPTQFTLGANVQQLLDIDVDLTGAAVVGTWVYGEVRLSASGRPDAVLPVTVFATGGEVPQQWDIVTERDGGSQSFNLSGLSAMPQAYFPAGGLVRPTNSSTQLAEDPSFDDPYDGGTGTLVVLHQVPAGALWLHAETLASPAEDLDMYVGRDANGDGLPQVTEEVCSSTTPEDLELCDVFMPSPGTWWIVVQNWESGIAFPDTTPLDVTLLSAVVNGGADADFNATGPGSVPAGGAFAVNLSWNNLDALPGETLLGAVGLGSSIAAGPNFGVVPVYVQRIGVANPQAMALHDGEVHRFAMERNDGRDMMFVDVPPGSTSLTIAVNGANATQSNNLRLDLYREGFGPAFDRAPFPNSILFNQGPPAGSPFRQMSGNGGVGPSITVSGGDLTAGRYYPVVRNQAGSPASLALSVDLNNNGSQLAFNRGLWQPTDRDIRQGVEYNGGANTRAIIWYTYRQDGAPTWYLASGPAPVGNTWVSNLYRFTNDGAQQQGTVVGKLVMTVLDADELIFSYTLFGESGSEIMRPSSPPGCPLESGISRSYTGLWYRGVSGLGGASVLVNASAQALIHYIFDSRGQPAWLYASAVNGVESMPILQWQGFCPLCSGSYSNQEVGVLTRDFASEDSGTWTLDYLLENPLAGNVDRTDDIIKLTSRIDCP